jgi:hypothetical protein
VTTTVIPPAAPAETTRRYRQSATTKLAEEPFSVSGINGKIVASDRCHEKTVSRKGVP